MQDEFSTSMRVAVTVWATGAMLGVVCGILSMSLSLLRDYSGTYNDAVVASTSASILAATRDDPQPGAVLYSRVEESLNCVDAVKINSTYIYKYNDKNCQNTICLLTTYKNKKFRVRVVEGVLNKSLWTIILEAV